MLYTSSENKKIKEIKKLHIKKYRDTVGKFLVEGEHLVIEAYKAGILQELLLEENTSFSLPILTNYVTSSLLKEISSLTTPQPILGICKKKDDVLEFPNRILLLDGIQDPGNLGTIIRSAVAFHVDMIVLSKDSVDIYNDKVLRASQGLEFHIPIFYRDLEEYIQVLKGKNYPIYATKVTGGKNVKTIEKIDKFAIIMGNEGKGVSDRILSLADFFLYIPMDLKCESLNVGVATSIILYALDK